MTEELRLWSIGANGFRGTDWCATRSFSTVSAGGSPPEFITSSRSAKSITWTLLLSV